MKWEFIRSVEVAIVLDRLTPGCARGKKGTKAIVLKRSNTPSASLIHESIGSKLRLDLPPCCAVA